MPTGTVGTNARQDPRQVTNTLKKIVNYNDVGIGAGVAFANYLPQGAFLTAVLCEIVTAFNAGTTNPLTVGTNSPTFNNIIAAADNTPGTPGVYAATRALGRSIANAGDVLPVAMYVPTGTAPTTGQAVIVIEYEGGWQS